MQSGDIEHTARLSTIQISWWILSLVTGKHTEGKWSSDAHCMMISIEHISFVWIPIWLHLVDMRKHLVCWSMCFVILYTESLSLASHTTWCICHQSDCERYRLDVWGLSWKTTTWSEKCLGSLHQRTMTRNGYNQTRTRNGNNHIWSWRIDHRSRLYRKVDHCVDVESTRLLLMILRKTRTWETKGWLRSFVISFSRRYTIWCCLDEICL